jgi:hypothetical protein
MVLRRKKWTKAGYKTDTVTQARPGALLFARTGPEWVEGRRSSCPADLSTIEPDTTPYNRLDSYQGVKPCFVPLFRVLVMDEPKTANNIADCHQRRYAREKSVHRVGWERIQL